MAANTWHQGGSGTLTATLTTTLNSTANDRLLVLHVAADTTSVKVTLDDGTYKFANAVLVTANTIRDFGPFFVPSGTSLRGGGDSANGDWHIDELWTA